MCQSRGIDEYRRCQSRKAQGADKRVMSCYLLAALSSRNGQNGSRAPHASSAATVRDDTRRPSHPIFG
jgi:hypothetical protein